MNAPVEAQSISSLSYLLANPPRYPRNPTHQVHEPLVLYIVRVPGSKDVFLTTLKPPTKASISIDAVHSSLYFLHVERPQDDALRESLEAARAAERSSNGITPIQRKPLPSTPFANYPASQRPPTPPKSYPHYQPPLPGSGTANQAQRYAARGANLRLDIGDQNPFPATSRKPVGARPLPARPTLEPPLQTINDEGSAWPSPIDQGHGQIRLARKPVQPPCSTHAGVPETAENRQDLPECSPVPLASPPSLSDLREEAISRPQPDSPRVTLIRRDPATGSQWNVGSITPHSAGGPLHEVEIELSSPGYTQFTRLDAASGSGFRRKVGYLSTSNQDGPSVTRRRSNSDESFSSSPFSNNRKARRAYAFISPWQGICAFSNGLDGRSLRCRQTLLGPNASMAAVIADVAELRFNLPWATNRLREPHKRPGTELSELSSNVPVARPESSSNREQWRRSFQALTHKARKQLSISDTKDDWQSPKEESPQPGRSGNESRMSLGLGREKAGGGFTGQSAKLGKLIIHDEGLKMCDLVVAACMGVWWQHYAGDM
ncbi:hypothetical protein A1O7_04010 [Cladophialophora yegresii CBS 114405]|uniref:Uncharacterized protein n=1 Tax=Cladophialophora yegresii CBS 114405 TaxID=1182544 RepID=W9VW33_9EURO|nr:uncharacterized protein A1O7_04010 [Cladophialophora yegresii CBS 114405]EXJ59863.1 hypothetical protein A1O7_04010 [Cladophialophora yegresii CBS 114405]